MTNNKELLERLDKRINWIKALDIHENNLVLFKDCKTEIERLNNEWGNEKRTKQYWKNQSRRLEQKLARLDDTEAIKNVIYLVRQNTSDTNIIARAIQDYINNDR